MKCISKAKRIIKKLHDCGYEAYIVGGYVRDMMLNIESNDIDITTNALPEEVMKLFNAYKNGIDYNSLTIIDGSDSFEITTFRRDVEYKDHRHPIIEYVDNLDDDLDRRDFTINALALDYSNNIIDKYNGLDDLKNKKIRTINDPLVRFDEDALRILRGLYLVSKLDFSFDELTYNAIKEKAYLLEEISKYRIIEEMKKIVSFNKDNKVFEIMKDTNCIDYIKPLNKAIEYMLDNNEIISNSTLFFSLAFYLNNGIDSDYEFTKAYKRKLKEIITISMNNIKKYDMISYEYDSIFLANELRRILKLNYIDNIGQVYDSLPIHSTKDIDITGIDLSIALDKLPGEWINSCYVKIANAILNDSLENKKEAIIAFIKKEV